MTSGGPIPPNIPTNFQTQNGTAVPAANILIVDAFDSIEDNANGLTSKGGVAAGDPPGSGVTNEVSIYLTNRFAGNVTTTDATPTTVASLNLALIGTGVFTFDVQVVGFDATDNEGVGYAIFGTLKNIAGTVTVIGTPDKINNEDVLPVNITSADVNLTFSGTSAIVQVIGIAAKTFRWRAVATYVYVG